ncbi:TauD/TfdA family dioxygenase [Vibrio ostreicida]|uniref:TauD/TfdA family dioxygenase n=1 Tax=Vibrio ostreicida TaxID=526588 RepID=UPI00097083DF|nr:TauD/TfdA family dioxygenase [Vibrio ostreicida]
MINSDVTINERYHPLKLPNACFHVIEQPNADIDIDLYKFILNKFGVLIIDLKFENRHSTLLETIVSELGKPHTHSTDEDAVWHIKQGGLKGREKLARSHKLEEFVLHTDCSYEQRVPNFFALQCIRSDKLSGGKNLFVDASTLIQHLSDTSLRTLQTEAIQIKVPPEFDRGVEAIKAHVIDENLNVRYRKELIIEASLSPSLKQAIEEFDHLCQSPLLNRWFELKDNQILIMDNRRYLHARTKINDKDRHLLRIRFFIDGEHFTV